MYIYDETGAPIGLKYREKGYTVDKFDSYIYGKNLQGDITEIYNESGTKVVEYKYDAWGNIISTTGTSASTVGAMNPFRYRGYYYDCETEFYYLHSRYYDPATGRFVNADDVSYLGADNALTGYNLYSYCGNNPVMRIDPDGHEWYHWVIGASLIVACAALTFATAGSFAGVAAAFASVVTATMAPTALSAVFAGATIGAVAIGAAGMLIGGISGDGGWSWENASQGFMIGSIAGVVAGGAWGGLHYALQNTGKMVVKTHINNLLNNPLDDFCKPNVGPHYGKISEYTRSISQTGKYEPILAKKVEGGMYQIINGHHRAAALRKLGRTMVRIKIGV